MLKGTAANFQGITCNFLFLLTFVYLSFAYSTFPGKRRRRRSSAFRLVVTMQVRTLLYFHFVYISREVDVISTYSSI